MQKLYERLFSTPVFRLEQLDNLVPEWSPQTRRQRLKDLVRAGRVGRVGLGVYFIVLPGQTPVSTSVDPYLVGAHLAPDAVLAYHTALELLGTAYSATRVVYYLSARYRKPMTWRAILYRQITPPRALSYAGAERLEVTSQERDGLLIPHTSRERTLVDCLDRLDLAGGLEELFRSIEAWPTVEPQRVLPYLSALDKVTLYAKVGYVMEQFTRSWGLVQADLEQFRQHVPHSPVYLESRAKPGHYISRWNLLVPTETALPTGH